MCAPVVAGAAIVGAGIQIYSSIKAGQDAADQARLNAKYSAAQAADARDRGETAAGIAELQGGKVVGEQKAAFGASGVEGGVGSPEDSQATSRMFSQIDAQTQRNNARREALGYSMQSTQLLQQASLDATRGDMQAAGAGISAVGNLAGQYGRYSASKSIY